MALMVTCDVALRGLASWSMKIPPKNAAVYNLVDVSASFIIYRLLKTPAIHQFLRDANRDSCFRIERFRRAFSVETQTNLLSLSFAKSVGILVGFFAAKALHTPVSFCVANQTSFISTVVMGIFLARTLRKA